MKQAPDEVNALLAQLISYYNNNLDKVKDFLKDTSECLKLYGIKVNTELNLPDRFLVTKTVQGRADEDAHSIETSKVVNEGDKRSSTSNQAIKSKTSFGEDAPTIIDIENEDDSSYQ